MNKTLNALLSRGIPHTLANNLVIKKETLASLNDKSDDELRRLTLRDEHIEAIRDAQRPAIPTSILHKILHDSWWTCCVCHRQGRNIVIHHIVEWADGGKHVEDNLAVLCLAHHDAAHLSGGLSLRLTTDRIRDAKKKWIVNSRRIRDVYEKRLVHTNGRSPRWYWIHIDNLKGRTATMSNLGVKLSDTYLATLKAKGFIDAEGHILPESQWKEVTVKPQKMYLFDSADAQLMRSYVSDLLDRYIENSAVLDITEMLDEVNALEEYFSVGDLVFFRKPVEITKVSSELPTSSEVDACVNQGNVRIDFTFNRWTSLNQSPHGFHLIDDMAERSIVGEIASIIKKGDQFRIRISPLGISPDFLPHGPTQGNWVDGGNNEDYRERKRMARDH